MVKSHALALLDGLPQEQLVQLAGLDADRGREVLAVVELRPVPLIAEGDEGIDEVLDVAHVLRP